jgi:tetratricopeptide (TPR) repeat protein
MAIEGPLRELGIHDVFQLLDLSRKTGALRVTSELRDNEGTVFFEAGKVVFATVRSNPHPIGTLLLRSGKITEAELDRARALQAGAGAQRRLGELLVELGAISARELERQVRLQVEAVVFELMSWNEGFFSFEEADVSGAPADATARISTESLLMEAARRIDEWSRIAYKVPSLTMIPTLAPAREDGPSLLDLLPNEWEVLTAIDGESDLRAIAASLARSEFDIAKVAYALLTTGVVELVAPTEATRDGPGVDAGPYVIQARIALAAGRGDDALAAAREALAADSTSVDARLVAARALLRLGRSAEAAEELRRAAAADPDHPDVQLELGYAAARRGDLDAALASWDRYLAVNATLPQTSPVRAANRAAAQLRDLLRAHANG